MQLQTFAAQDANGNVQTSPTVYIYTLGTQTVISGLQDVNGDPLSNPFTGNADGRIVVRAPTGTYSMRAVKGAFDETQVVQFIDLADQVAEATTQVGLATTQANNAASSATAAANSAAAAAEIVNITEVQTFTNPLQPAPRVAMTGASSGSRGWLVQDDVNVDNPTNDFTLTVPGIKLSDYSPSAEKWLYYKYVDANNYWGWKINTAGTMTFIAVAASVTVLNVTSTAAIPSARDGDAIKPSIVVTRETAAAAGSAVFSVDGVQLGTSVAITAAATADISNSGSLYILGTNAIRYASEVLAAIMYNRALSATQVLSLCKYGVDPADVGGDNSAQLVANGNFDDGLTSWTRQFGGSGGTSSVTDGILTIEAPAGQTEGRRQDVSLTIGKRYRFRVLITERTGGIVDLYAAAGFAPLIIRTGTAGSEIVHEFVATSSTVRVYIYASGAGDTSISVDYALIEPTGATLQLSAQDAQSNTGQVFDSSGNGNHALLPSSGATVLGKPVSEPKQVRGTNSWAETHEIQYIGGSNHPILPANAIIESIVGVITSTGGSGVQDIIIGDGSDADRYVTITTGLTTGTKVFTLTATPFTDGTNLKLTVDPDLNCTMSIAWTITYRTLEN